MLGGNLHGQPRLAIDEPDFDFGSVARHSVVAHEFWFRSTGSDTLLISEIKTGCGCVAAMPPQASVRPGDSLAVTFYWHLRNDEGESRRTSWVFTGAGADPRRVTLTATCGPGDGHDEEAISVQPPRIVFDTAGAQGTLERSAALRNRSDEDYAVSLVSGPGVPITVELPDSLPAGSTRRVNVRLAPRDWSPALTGSVTLEFIGEGGEEQRITLPVTGGNSRIESLVTTNQK